MANEFIKRAHAESEFTPELIQELMKCRKDAVYFIKNYVMLQHPTKGKMLFKLYDFQEELIIACHTQSRVIALLSRQMGKCFSGCTFINTISKPKGFRRILLKLLNRKLYESIFNNGNST